jgi:hypothetical protein
MSFSKPAVIFTDVEAWAITYLATDLAATVSNRTPETIDDELVTVRDDGGPRSEVTKTSSLAVNAWAPTEEAASDLVRMAVALLESSPGSGPIVAHASTFGPSRVPEESGRPHWFATVDLVHRGVAL